MTNRVWVEVGGLVAGRREVGWRGERWRGERWRGEKFADGDFGEVGRRLGG